MISMKSRETIFGLQYLSESILRALIVFCNNGNLSKYQTINFGTKNIGKWLKRI